MIEITTISCEYCGFTIDIPQEWKQENNRYICPKCKRKTPFKTISLTGY